MRSLSSPINTQKDADSAGWCEVYDFYLKEAITTPWGSASVIRITTLPGDLSFFTPTVEPEPSATQGDPATYRHWPVKREIIRGTANTQNDRLNIVASNVTGEWAQMLSDVDWYDVPVVIRKVSTTITSPTENDCVIIFIGQIDSATVNLNQIQFVVSNDLGSLQTIAPRENMHQSCRFNWGDDQCTAIRHLSENFKPKTCESGSSTTRVKAAFAGYTGQAVTADAGTDKIALTSHALLNNHRVRFGGTTVPGGLTRGTWYWVVNKATNDFQVALTVGGSAIDITSAGTSVTIDSETGFTEDGAAIGYVGQAVTADAGTDKISLTAHGLDNGDRVKFGGTAVPGGLTAGTWYWVVNKAANDFKVALTEGGTAIDLTSAGTSVTMDSTAPYGTDEVDGVPAFITQSSEGVNHTNASIGTVILSGTRWIFLTNHGLYFNDPVTFGGTPPSPLVAATTYYVSETLAGNYFRVSATLSGPTIELTTNGTSPTVSTVNSSDADSVRYSNAGNWKLGDLADWGTVTDGFITLADAQAGMANAELKPYIGFDFGAATWFMRAWRIKQPEGTDANELVRTVLFFSSTDAVAWTFQRYAELPPRLGAWSDILIPTAPNARYWRICIRSRWGEIAFRTIFSKIRGHQSGRNWWAQGRIKFDEDTATAALRGISRRVRGSFAGVIECDALPAAPASGDRFTIERGCPRTFNGCGERRNTENFGGFLELPSATVIR